MINSITLVSPSFDQIGMTFDPTVAMLNHSCNPNAAIVFDENMLSVRSIRDITEGEQVTISYIDNTFKRARRRRELREKYYFECHCKGCEPANGNFTGRDSWLCDKQNCQTLIPEPTSKGEFKCPKCHSAPLVTLDQLRSLENKALTVLESPPASDLKVSEALNDILLPTLQTLTSCPSWPPIRQPAPALRRQIYHLALDSQNYEAAFHHSNLLSSFPLSDIHPEPFHPLRTVQLFTTASLISLLAAEQNNVEYLKRSWELLRVTWDLCRGTHGEDSQFAKRVATKRTEVEADLAMTGEDMRRAMRVYS
jgi:SET domain